jgi:hypothetical protein
VNNGNGEEKAAVETTTTTTTTTAITNGINGSGEEEITGSKVDQTDSAAAEVIAVE